MSKGVLIIAGGPKGDDGGGMPNRVLVPKEALTEGDTAPSEGDDVNGTWTGKVVGMQGDNLVVEIAEVNDAPVGSGASDEEATPDDGGRQEALDAVSQGGNNGDE